ncbi:MAG: diguanylate cyclase (GGDEF)-like protein [Paraglaciecola sp.]|jgi:diguanylate cyclase (GGDEF)-like protein
MTFHLTKNLVICLLILYSFITFGSQDYGQILRNADHIRSSAPDQSQLLLDGIDIKQLTPADSDLYDYLSAYHISLQGHLDEAGKKYKRLIKHAKSENITVRALTSLLVTQVGAENWPGSLTTANILLTKQEMQLAPDTLDLANISLAQFYNHIGEHKLGKKFATQIIERSLSPRMLCAASSVLLDARIELAISELDVKDFIKAENNCIVAGEKILRHGVISYMATYFFKMQKPKDALDILEKNIQEVEASHFGAMIVTFHQKMANGYMAVGQENRAQHFASQIIATRLEHQYAPAITTAYKLLAQIAEINQDYNEAIVFYKKYYHALQLTLDNASVKQLAIQKAKLDAIEKNTQINLLDNENALLKAQVELANKSAENDRLFMTLIGLVAIIIFLWAYKNRRHHQKLRVMAQTDELTGAANRRHFNQQANNALAYCQKTGQPISFILFDLDFFKKVNDNFGHQTGDWVLKEVVAVAQATCRSNDFMGRLGGEEFGILLPGCSVEKAMLIAEQCRLSIAAIDSQGCGHQFSLTASFGVSDAQTCGYQLDRLFAAADAALYKCKDSGRNCIHHFESDQLAFELPATQM